MLRIYKRVCTEPPSIHLLVAFKPTSTLRIQHRNRLGSPTRTSVLSPSVLCKHKFTFPSLPSGKLGDYGTHLHPSDSPDVMKWCCMRSLSRVSVGYYHYCRWQAAEEKAGVEPLELSSIVLWTGRKKYPFTLSIVSLLHLAVKPPF